MAKLELPKIKYTTWIITSGVTFAVKNSNVTPEPEVEYFPESERL